MSWLLVLILIAGGRPQLVIRPVASEAVCEKTVELIRSTRPGAIFDYKCVDVAEYAGLAI